MAEDFLATQRSYMLHYFICKIGQQHQVCLKASCCHLLSLNNVVDVMQMALWTGAVEEHPMQCARGCCRWRLAQQGRCYWAYRWQRKAMREVFQPQGSSSVTKQFVTDKDCRGQNVTWHLLCCSISHYVPHHCKDVTKHLWGGVKKGYLPTYPDDRMVSHSVAKQLYSSS